MVQLGWERFAVHRRFGKCWEIQCKLYLNLTNRCTQPAEAHASSKLLKLSSSPTSFIFNVEIDGKGEGTCLTEQDKSAKEVIVSNMSQKTKAL